MAEPVTTHVLSLVSGQPAEGIVVRLSGPDGLLAEGVTDADGRVATWSRSLTLVPGTYGLEFAVGPWFQARGERSFYEDVQISFRVDDAAACYHVPLLLSPFGYSTYRGS